jgi:hypothetical protein
MEKIIIDCDEDTYFNRQAVRGPLGLLEAFTGNWILCHSQNALKRVLVRSSILEN